MKGFWQKHKKKLSSLHLLVAVGHLIMEICFESFSNPFEAGVTLVLTGTAIFISIFVIWIEKK